MKKKIFLTETKANLPLNDALYMHPQHHWFVNNKLQTRVYHVYSSYVRKEGKIFISLVS